MWYSNYPRQRKLLVSMMQRKKKFFMRYFMIIIAVLWWYMLLLLSRSYEFISEIYVEKFFFAFRETRNKSSARSDPIQHYKFPIIYRFILPRIRLPRSRYRAASSFSRRPLKCFNIFFAYLLLIFISLLRQCITRKPYERTRLMMEL